MRLSSLRRAARAARPSMTGPRNPRFAPPRTDSSARPTRAHLPVVAAIPAVAALVLVPLGYLVWRTFFDDGTLTLRFVREAYAADGLAGMACGLAPVRRGGDGRRARHWRAARLAARPHRPPAPSHVLGRRAACRWSSRECSTRLVDLPREPERRPDQHVPRRAPRRRLRPGRDDRRRGPPPRPARAPDRRGGEVGRHVARGAALCSGATLGRSLRRITLPMLRPALLAAALVSLIRAFGELRGARATRAPRRHVGPHVARVHRAPALPDRIAFAGAYAQLLVTLTCGGASCSRYSRAAPRIRDGDRARVGAAPAARAGACRSRSRPVSVRLGRRGAPMLALCWISTQPHTSTCRRARASRARRSPATPRCSSPRTLHAFWNSAVLGTGAATVTLVLGAVIGWIAVRSRLRGRHARRCRCVPPARAAGDRARRRPARPLAAHPVVRSTGRSGSC